MSISLQTITESRQHDRNRAAIKAFEQAIHRLLDGFHGTALTRNEIGEAFKAGAVGITGIKLDDQTRELLLLLAQMLSPQVRQTVKDGSDALDHALTNLVARGTVRMTLVDLQAHFWTPIDSTRQRALAR